ncbi:hypothetical protein MRB53_041975 [Persea americana]|nr:hypothetical protein MRB53_041975 [Persea americana]
MFSPASLLRLPTKLRPAQHHVGKVAGFVLKHGQHPQPRPGGQRLNLGQGKLVGIFGVNGLPGRKLKRAAPQRPHPHGLGAAAYQPRAHGPGAGVVVGVVQPVSELKVSVQPRRSAGAAG